MIFKTYFFSIKHQKWFQKMVFKDYVLELFLKIIIKQAPSFREY